MGRPTLHYGTWLSSCLADDVALMYAGQIVETGSIDGVLDAPRHPYTKGLLSSVPSRNARGVPLRQIPGAAPAANRFPAGCVFRPRCARAGAYCIEEPELIEASEGQLVRCFNPEETVGRRRPPLIEARAVSKRFSRKSGLGERIAQRLDSPPLLPSLTRSIPSAYRSIRARWWGSSGSRGAASLRSAG